MNDGDKTQEQQLIDKYDEMEEVLRETEKRYQALIETNLYGIQEIDIYGNITFMNSVQYEILGYPEGELRGKQIWDLLASDSERNELTDYLTKIALGEYAPFPWVGKYVRSDGDILKLKIDWNCRRDRQETVTGFVSVISDIMNRNLPENHFQAHGDKTAEEEPETVSADADEPAVPEVLPESASSEEYIPEILQGAESTVLTGIQTQLDHLQKEFQSKLKYDAHKDKMIDKLHKELQEYKGDILKKYLQSMIMDIIQMIDNVKKLAAHYSAQDPSENDPEKLLRLLEGIPSDLEDLFYRQGVNTYTCDDPIFDGSRQKILKTVEVPDKSKDKTVAESLRPGYEWEGKIIRPEMISVYVYKAGGA